MILTKEIHELTLLNMIGHTRISAKLDRMADVRRIVVETIDREPIVDYMALFQPRFGNPGLWLSIEAVCGERYFLLKYISEDIKRPATLFFLHRSGQKSWCSGECRQSGAIQIRPEIVEMIAGDPIDQVRVLDDKLNIFVDYCFEPRRMQDKLETPGMLRSDLFSWICRQVLLLRTAYTGN